MLYLFCVYIFFSLPKSDKYVFNFLYVNVFAPIMKKKIINIKKIFYDFCDKLSYFMTAHVN